MDMPLLMLAAMNGGEEERLELIEMMVQSGGDLPDLMLNWLVEYAEQGSDQARGIYCYLALQGEIPDCDWLRLEQWLLAMMETNPELANLQLGLLYAPGGPAFCDVKMAESYFRRGAELGNPNCWVSLALMFHENETAGHGPEEVRELLERGLAAGVCAPPVYETLAEVCDDLGDARAAMDYLKRFHKLVPDNERNCMLLAYNYKFGNGCRADESLALKYYQKAANLGSGEGLFEVGLAYYEGCGTRRNCKRAVDYFRRAVDAGNPRGYYYLGMCHIEGDGVRMAPEKGVEFLEKGAAGGDLQSFLSLATCYAAGVGVEPDAERAAELLSQARALEPYAGIPEIQEMISQVESSMFDMD